MDSDRETGINAIIFLQKMAGIDEPRERAEKNWDRFAAWEKESTLKTYKMFSEKK